MAIDNQIYFSNDDQLTDINPLFIGEECCSPNHSYGPRICPYTIIHYVISGNGTLECSGKSYEVSEGQIFIIFTGEIATYKADENSPWNYMWISFDGIYADKLKELGTNVATAPKGLFEEILRKYRSRDCDKHFAVSMLYLLYSNLLPSCSVRKKTSYPSEVKKMIKHWYMDIVSVADIAKRLNIDKRYMSRIFKERYGKTVIGYLVEVRIKKACELLKNGYSVADTASIVGYADSFNFSKMFKKIMGISPSEYKKLSTEVLTDN